MEIKVFADKTRWSEAAAAQAASTIRSAIRQPEQARIVVRTGTSQIVMSVRQIIKAKVLLAVVPEERKALAVKACFEESSSPQIPASILRTHSNATAGLDRDSASWLSPEFEKSGAHEPQITILGS